MARTAEGRARASSPRAALRRLEALKAGFGEGRASEKLALLRALDAAPLATAAEVDRLHEALCFLRAYPDDRAVRAQVERMLAGFAGRADLARHRAKLADSGIAGTVTRFRFFAPMARWLAERHPARLTVDWDAAGDTALLEHLLPLLALRAEDPALDEYDLGLREWIGRLKGPDETDAAFLARRFFQLPLPDEALEKLWDEIDLPLVLAPGPDTPSRTRALLPRAPRGFQGGPLTRDRPDLAAELAAPAPAVRVLSRAEGERVIDLAREAMIARQRDLDAFSYGDPADARLVEFADGLAFACVGVRPGRRLMLEAVYAFLTLKNGVPIGYVLNSALYGSAEMAYNVFETWRGAEAGRVYGRVLAMVRHLFGADTFTIYPYQLGHGNEEAIGSGAWWFYQKLGFRPKEAGVRRLMEAELARMERRPAHRSSAATLRKLARENLYYHHGRARDDVIGMLPLANVGLHVTRLLASRWGSDRARAERDCAAEAARLLGGGPAAGWTAAERMWWRHWAPLVLTLPGVGDWSAADRRALVEVIRTKGGRRESDFVRAFDAHAPLRAAV
ncbi:MAG: hypothetical protein MUC84_11870, partial [Solirubrobacteraceae bacterium]|nr:hypothetical protein [Solirubrobacteraceae bacterium]